MEVKPLNIDDYNEVIQLWKRAELDHRPKGRDSKAAISQQIKTDPDLFLGAFENEKLIGVMIGSFDGRKGWINRLAVYPMYRGQGIAKRLIEAIELALRKRGARLICTLIEDWNKNSMHLFEKCRYIKHDSIIYFSKRESDEI